MDIGKRANLADAFPYQKLLANVSLAEKSRLELSEEQKDFLVTVTAFNIRARYDDYKLAFYNTCTKEYTTTWINEIKGFRKWIRTELSKS